MKTLKVNENLVDNGAVKVLTEDMILSIMVEKELNDEAMELESLSAVVRATRDKETAYLALFVCTRLYRLAKDNLDNGLIDKPTYELYSNLSAYVQDEILVSLMTY